jgi:hypothetical protein
MHRASSASCARLTRNVSHHATLVGEPLQEGLGRLCMAPCGIPETSLPPAERGRVDADGPSGSVLRDPCTVAPGLQALTKCGAGNRRIEAEEIDDARQEAKGGLRPVQLPVGDGGLGDAEPVGNLTLQQPEVEPPLP